MIRFALLDLIILAGAVLASYLLMVSLRNHRVLGILLCAVLLLVILYNVYDNDRIVVRPEMVYIANLPPAFEDFTILQISDLHGQTFGPEQSNLIAKVNSIDYDMIAFTGDMEGRQGDFTAFVALLDGIANKENMFYVNGNSDLAYNSFTGIKSKTGELLEAHSCILLTEPYPLQRAGQTLWLGHDLTKNDDNRDFYQGIAAGYFGSSGKYQAYLDHRAAWDALTAQLKDNGDIKIALTHIPHTRSDLEQKTSQANNLDYDLILAGHYHGGQFRIPFYGAVYIPVESPRLGQWFPDQKYVSGLVEVNGIQQYVSRGLGASNVPFRLFDTPEINLIILRAK